jgi:putative spermidine/putrescine transport system substrate-binding protein
MTAPPKTAPKASRRVSVVKAAARPTLRVLGTEVTLLEPLREQAERDLGLDIRFESLNFVDAQRKAAMQPESFDVYDQCFHNLEIVWHWQAIQPIDTQRITLWDQVSELTKSGRLRATAQESRGDAPLKNLYVQPGHILGRRPSRHISMLPTVYNVDSFVYLPSLFSDADAGQATWGWLFDEQARGRLALVDEPAIGPFDAALALEALGLLRFADIGNMSVLEIDQMMALLNARKREGFFCGLWKSAAESVEFMLSGRAAIQSIWSPGVNALRSAGKAVIEAVPREGYRAWHGGLCLSSGLSSPALDSAYRYLNWWLSGWPGALMSRQGHYFSVPSTLRKVLAADEWDYWYEGRPARRDLPGADGRTVVSAGQSRAGGSYAARTDHIALWNTTMDEHNYLVRRWTEFAASASL